MQPLGGRMVLRDVFFDSGGGSCGSSASEEVCDGEDDEEAKLWRWQADQPVPLGVLEPKFLHRDAGRYVRQMAEENTKWINSLKTLRTQYGVTDESELLTGIVRATDRDRQRSRKDKDVASRMTFEVRKLIELTSANLLRIVPSAADGGVDQQQQVALASAAYIAAYEQYRSCRMSGGNVAFESFLSFPWAIFGAELLQLQDRYIHFYRSYPHAKRPQLSNALMDDTVTPPDVISDTSDASLPLFGCHYDSLEVSRLHHMITTATSQLSPGQLTTPIRRLKPLGPPDPRPQPQPRVPNTHQRGHQQQQQQQRPSGPRPSTSSAAPAGRPSVVPAPKQQPGPQHTPFASLQRANPSPVARQVSAAAGAAAHAQVQHRPTVDGDAVSTRVARRPNTSVLQQAVRTHLGRSVGGLPSAQGQPPSQPTRTVSQASSAAPQFQDEDLWQSLIAGSNGNGLGGSSPAPAAPRSGVVGTPEFEQAWQSVLPSMTSQRSIQQPPSVAPPPSQESRNQPHPPSPISLVSVPESPAAHDRQPGSLSVAPQPVEEPSPSLAQVTPARTPAPPRLSASRPAANTFADTRLDHDIGVARDRDGDGRLGGHQPAISPSDWPTSLDGPSVSRAAMRPSTRGQLHVDRQDESPLPLRRQERHERRGYRMGGGRGDGLRQLEGPERREHDHRGRDYDDNRGDRTYRNTGHLDRIAFPPRHTPGLRRHDLAASSLSRESSRGAGRHGRMDDLAHPPMPRGREGRYSGSSRPLSPVRGRLPQQHRPRSPSLSSHRSPTPPRLPRRVPGINAGNDRRDNRYLMEADRHRDMQRDDRARGAIEQGLAADRYVGGNPGGRGGQQRGQDGGNNNNANIHISVVPPTETSMRMHQLMQENAELRARLAQDRPSEHFHSHNHYHQHVYRNTDRARRLMGGQGEGIDGGYGGYGDCEVESRHGSVNRGEPHGRRPYGGGGYP
ncbi:unnamed protein product [Vitrella brassicaformis CCMP3155]|uniref:RDRP C-terminal head domain-containing protein n=3 Tax=Vitrella brassicaformis TaxID=1169539 RepID=A0A0G4EIF3_VITBC|nr:unnamed protein product [Vitrella brassicaformis CCMP3155]|mmetsp:Transcript_5126/g.14041  ORF Transcript_5126/g.14041 Transcript_5126/m.14041 type:complete len:956 (-) Transcript_5126:856-3723(-)|eukprot:CEL96778.1 unnamed protein product [Vitrella brassicaformis CCMP3155]